MLFTWLKTLNKLNRHVNESLVLVYRRTPSSIFKDPCSAVPIKEWGVLVLLPYRQLQTSIVHICSDWIDVHLNMKRTPNSNLIIYRSLQLIARLNVCCKTRGSVHVTIENNIDLNIWGHGTELEFHYVTIVMGVFASSCTLIDRHVTGEVSSEIRKFSTPGLMLLENHR